MHFCRSAVRFRCYSSQKNEKCFVYYAKKHRNLQFVHISTNCICYNVNIQGYFITFIIKSTMFVQKQNVVPPEFDSEERI